MFNKVYVVKENHLKIILKKIFNQFTCVCCFAGSQCSLFKIMKIILLVLCAAAALSSSESYILRPQPVNVYYGVPRFQRGKSSTKYGRFTVIINKNPKTEEELKSLPDSRAVLDWAMKNGQYITENEIFKDKPQMLTFINGEKAKNRVFYTPGLNLRERLRRRRRQILEHKYPTAHEMVLSRSQRAVPFLLTIFGVFGSIKLFLAIYLPYQSDHLYLYNNNGLYNKNDHTNNIDLYSRITTKTN